MLNDIKIKKAVSVLGALKNRVVGSNKSKANLSIIDRIRKYYLELAIDAEEIELEKLGQEKVEIEESLDDYKDKLKKGLEVEDNKASLREIEKEIKKEELNQINNEVSREALTESIEDKKAKLNEILEKEATVIEPIKNEVNINLDDVSKNLEAEALKVALEEEQEAKVESELKNVEQEIKNSVNNAVESSKEEIPVEKESTEIVKDDMIERVNQFISKYNEDMLTLSNTLIQDISVAYEQKLQEQSSLYEDKLTKQAEADKQKISKIASASEKALALAGEDIKTKENKISELETTNGALTSNLEAANKTIVEKDTKINELNQTVASNQEQLSIKDAELEALRKEVKRLQVFENGYNMMKEASKEVSEEAMSLEESIKSL